MEAVYAVTVLVEDIISLTFNKIPDVFKWETITFLTHIIIG